MASPELLTIGQFCERYYVSRSTVYRLFASGDLRRVVIGRAVRIKRIDAEEWFDTLMAA
jgi:excisionase family DNA binding protein